MVQKTLILTFISILFNTVVYSQNGNINIEKKYFNIDTKKNLIVINKGVEKLNSLHLESKNSISSEGLKYVFITPVLEFKIGQSYKVVSANNNHYSLYFTQLPIIHITTHKTIVDEPRVYAHFLMQETNGKATERAMGIETRGASSQITSKKKSYRIEFWENAFGLENKDIALLGMRNDNDWNLQAMPNEPLRIRSKVNFELWRKIDTLHYHDKAHEAINGIRQEYAELFLNNDYQGIYLLSERVDRKQLQLKKPKHGTVNGELYKGIGWGKGTTTFTYLANYSKNEIWDGFECKYPDKNTSWLKLYGFADFVINADSTTFYGNYQSLFDIDNAVNYFLFLNLLRATDNTGKNLFIAKHDENTPYFYIPWDLDGAFGTIWSGERQNRTNDILINGFYERLIFDNTENGFVKRLKNRWNELRTDLITTDSILTSFNVQFNYLKNNGVYERESIAWGSQTVDYSNIYYTKKWLEKRIIFLDSAFNNPAVLTNLNERLITSKTSLVVYPNPASQYLYYHTTYGNQDLEKIAFYDHLGRPLNVNILLKNNGQINVSNIEKGIYLIVADFKNGYRETQKIVIK